MLTKKFTLSTNQKPSTTNMQSLIVTKVNMEHLILLNIKILRDYSVPSKIVTSHDI